MLRRFVIFCALIVCVLCLRSSEGQTSVPVIIQAATPAPTVAAIPVAAAPENDSSSILRRLQEMQATNAGTIKRQEAALATLDELQKAAEELKIFSKRG